MVRAVERYKGWVTMVRSGDVAQVGQAVIELEERPRPIGLSGGEQRLLVRARGVLGELSPGG